MSSSTAIDKSAFTGTSNIASDPSKSGLVAGYYKLEKTIGQGTYGKVRLAVDIRTGDKVAVKVLEKANIKNKKQVERIQREIRFLKLLHHPNIVKIFDVVETTDLIYIVMEYATGGELFDYIVTHKRVKEKEARSFFRQVLSAVDYCHRNAVIHRDLKPENLLLDDSKSIKIIDFGFSNTYKTDTLLSTFCGSPFYAAPEMILGKKYEGPEVDMWSLGVILFALLCGHLPFDDDNVKELYRKIASATYKMPSHVPEPCKFLISRMITVDPKKRATLQEIIDHPWINEGYTAKLDNHLPPRLKLHSNELSNDILQRLATFGYSPDQTKKAFDDYNAETAEFEHDGPKPKIHPEVTTYYLMREMLQREEEKSQKMKELAVAKAAQAQVEVERKAAQEKERLAQQPQQSVQQPVTTQPVAQAAHSRKFSLQASVESALVQAMNNVSKRVSRVKVEDDTKEQHNIAASATNLYAIREDNVVSEEDEFSGNLYVQPQKQRNNLGSMPAHLNSSNNGISTSSKSTTTGSSDLIAGPSTGTPGAQPNPMKHPLKVGKEKSASMNQLSATAPRSRSRPSSIKSPTADQPTPTRTNHQRSSTEGDSTKNPLVAYLNTKRASIAATIRAPIGRRGSSNSMTNIQTEVRAVSGWFLNVATTSAKAPADLLAEVIRCLNSLGNAGVKFEHDPQGASGKSPWVVVVAVNTGIFDSVVEPDEATSPAALMNVPTDTTDTMDETDLADIPSSPNGIDDDDDDDDDGSREESIDDTESHSTFGSVGTNVTRVVPAARRVSFFRDTATAEASRGNLVFEIEICRVPKLNLNGLIFKRLTGSVWSYKKVCSKILTKMNL